MTTKLNILLLQPDFSRYNSAYYQHQFTKALGRVHQVYRYGPKLAGYDQRHTIDDVLKLCPFEPDLICFGAGWENENLDISEFDPHPAINAAKVNVPSVLVLNKEYKKLEGKFRFIQDNRIRLVFTTHHHYTRWEEQVGVPFIHFPFAVDPELFRDYGERKRYALGFSGSLHTQWLDLRGKIKEHLFLRWPIKRPRYWGMRLFWSEVGRRRVFRRVFRVPRGENYARLINRSKIWLSTPSAVDIVGTRYYEIMAAKTLLMCSRSPAYEGLFKEGTHCVMFEPDLQDFDETLGYYLEHEDARQRIVDEAYGHVLREHTWDKRIEQFTDAVMTIL